MLDAQAVDLPIFDEIFVVDRKTAKKDLTVHVKLAVRGFWHKKAVGGEFTACGEPLGGYATRPEAYEGDMCPTCFTMFERHKLATKPDRAP